MGTKEFLAPFLFTDGCTPRFTALIAFSVVAEDFIAVVESSYYEPIADLIDRLLSQPCSGAPTQRAACPGSQYLCASSGFLQS